VTITVPSLNRLPAAERGITLGDFLVPIGLGERISSRARHVALIVAGAILVSLSALVVIPLQPVPITGQTFAVLLVGGALGARRGFLSLSLYLVMGFFLPVYAERSSGIATIATFEGGQLILGATGGYLVGFVLAATVVGRLAELGWDRHIGGAIAAMAIGNAVIYLVGVPWLAAALGMPLGEAVDVGLRPFLLGDAIKIVAAAAVFPIAWWVVGRRPGER
jgi:biotin transport system substrate-specific component